jgi:hypothetical protein
MYNVTAIYVRKSWGEKREGQCINIGFIPPNECSLIIKLISENKNMGLVAKERNCIFRNINFHKCYLSET